MYGTRCTHALIVAGQPLALVVTDLFTAQVAAGLGVALIADTHVLTGPNIRPHTLIAAQLSLGAAKTAVDNLGRAGTTNRGG